MNKENFSLRDIEMNEKRVLRDAIHDYIHVDHLVIWHLINSQEMQRLRRVKQLGGTYQVFQSAEHSRFVHSLGVYQVVRRMLETECLDNELNDYDKLCVMCAGLLHDIGHGPFSHSFEGVFKEDHENITMKTDIVVGIERFLEKNYAKYNHISISWFGGEPTLCKDIVLRINRLIKSLVDNDKSKYTFTMTTNGYLLDEQSFLEYYDSGIVSYQITLDGWNHDKKRLLKNGQPTLKKIIENLDAIHKLPDTYKFNIMIRNNILAGDRDFSWYDFLNERYGEDVRFGILVRQVCDLGGEGVKSLDLLHAITGKKLIKDHINYIDNLKIRCDNTGNIGLGNEMCYASYKNGFTIRASGKVEKCTVALNKSQNEVGYIDGYGNLHLDLKKNEVWSENILYDKCFSCNKIFSCLNNMCPFKRILIENYICDNYQSFEDEG